MSKLATVVSKVTSGRFLCVTAFSVTMCYLAIIEGSVRDAFFALAGAVIRDYFMMKREVTSGNTKDPVVGPSTPSNP